MLFNILEEQRTARCEERERNPQLEVGTEALKEEVSYLRRELCSVNDEYSSVVSVFCHPPRL